jgi:hypothetical protein
VQHTAESYCGLLRLFDTFSRAEDHSIPPFSYRHEDEGLRQLLSQYSLDELKGDGDSLDQIINLMIWLHDTIIYNGCTRKIISLDSLSLLPSALKHGCGLNCSMMATILAEVYLALGFCARTVYLHGLSPYDWDNHVVALVWLESERKWVLMDPSLGQYYRDEDGVYLDPWELRVCMANEKKIFCRENRQERPITPRLKRYMAKNLFYFYSPLDNGFGSVTLPGQKWLVMHPRGIDMVRRERLHLEWCRRSGLKNRQWDDAIEAYYLTRKARLENDALLRTSSHSTFFKAPCG